MTLRVCIHSSTINQQTYKILRFLSFTCLKIRLCPSPFTSVCTSMEYLAQETTTIIYKLIVLSHLIYMLYFRSCNFAQNVLKLWLKKNHFPRISLRFLSYHHPQKMLNLFSFLSVYSDMLNFLSYHCTQYILSFLSCTRTKKY